MRHHQIDFDHFNEAGAKSAGKRRRIRAHTDRAGRTSMRPAQKAPENAVDELSGAGAALVTSMRPAQKAPENHPDRRRRQTDVRNFNEAGAKSAGKPLPWRISRGWRSDTSMRPAQKAPENTAPNSTASRATTHFNEAGAKSAGKPVGVTYWPCVPADFNEAGAKSAGKPTQSFRVSPCHLSLQ